jgi:hypothetical protein
MVELRAAEGDAMDIDALAALAANTLVAAAVTDAFEGFRAKLAGVFGRDKPDQNIQQRLDSTRQRLAAATQNDLQGTRATQARQWETRFADLLADRPAAAAELEALLAEFPPMSNDTGGNVTNAISGTVNGPALLGRDFGDVTIGGQAGRPAPPAARS